MIELNTTDGIVCYTNFQICEMILEKEGYIYSPLTNLWEGEIGLRIHQAQVIANPVGVVQMYLKLNWTDQYDIVKKLLSKTKGLGVLEVNKCKHAWQIYNGLHENYNYCTNCGCKE